MPLPERESCDLQTWYMLTDGNQNKHEHSVNLNLPDYEIKQMSWFDPFTITCPQFTVRLKGCKNLSSGAVLVSTTSRECRDSDADLDVDGDDTLEYGRAQYPLQ